MPTISRFFGIIIFMNYNDHLSPTLSCSVPGGGSDGRNRNWSGAGQDVSAGVAHGVGMVGKISAGTYEQLESSANAIAAGSTTKLGDSMFLHVTKIRDVSAFELRLEFSDGVVKRVNLSGELHGEVFEPLKDPQFFKRVFLNPETGTIEWPNGADFAPEFLYEIGQEIKQVA